MRGKALAQFLDIAATRITPAYAGKRVTAAVIILYAQDHPRLCGEKLFAKDNVLQTAGSPPPMRGKEKKLQNAIDKPRITPAYAGKRLLPDYSPRTT